MYDYCLYLYNGSYTNLLIDKVIANIDPRLFTFKNKPTHILVTTEKFTILFTLINCQGSFKRLYTNLHMLVQTVRVSIL